MDTPLKHYETIKIFCDKCQTNITHILRHFESFRCTNIITTNELQYSLLTN